MKRILILAYKYPPYAQIGAKRWAKFSKYLARKHEVHVITVNWKKKPGDSWLKDVIHPNIKIHRIVSMYPHNLKYRKFGEGLFGRICALARFAFLSTINPIYFEDEAQLWGLSMIPYARKIIKKYRIRNVIATGSPFMVNCWAAKLKEKMPEINLIQDFRDPWYDDKIRPYPLFFKELTKPMEKFALDNADIVVTVTDGVRKLLERKCDTRIEVIANGEDISDMPKKVDLTERFILTYTGDLLAGRDKGLDSLLKAIENAVKNEDFRNDFCLRIYGRHPLGLRKRYSHLIEQGSLELHSPVSYKEIRQKMSQSSMLVLINSHLSDCRIPSKFYEYVGSGRQILCITPEGDLDTLMKKNKLGISFRANDVNEIQEGLLEYYNKWKNKESLGLYVDEEFIRSISYESLVEKLENLLR